MSRRNDANLVLVPIPSFITVSRDWPLTEKGAAALAAAIDEDAQRDHDKQLHPSALESEPAKEARFTGRPSHIVHHGPPIPRHIADSARELQQRRHAASRRGNVIQLFPNQSA